MTIKTESGSSYRFIIVENTIRTAYRGRELIVTEIKNLQIGNRLYVKGFALNPITYSKTSEEFHFLTSPIVNIS